MVHNACFDIETAWPYRHGSDSQVSQIDLPMRPLLWTAVLASLAAATPAEGRLFWQTYGATVATPGGCVWNLNQDYFVPRHCDSCRYDLLSPAKTYHTTSPACKNLHPGYAGYCTPYGECHYRRKDHVYKVHCGCTPLEDALGTWKLERCRKHAYVLRPSAGGNNECTACGAHAHHTKLGLPADAQAVEGLAPVGCLPHVEPLGGVILGSVAALPAGSGPTSATALGSVPPGMNSAAAPSILPTLGLTPSTSAPAAGALPPVSSF
jgi:hypothetical protein